MNTFLPYADFKASAKVLDMRRLGKQRVEVLQLVNAIQGGSKGWVNHPCTRMWRPHLQSLISYGETICEEWTSRGYEDSIGLQLYMLKDLGAKVKNPPWLGSPALHSSHRANLLRKDPVFYGKFRWTEKPLDGYFWPHPNYYWKAYELT